MIPNLGAGGDRCRRLGRLAPNSHQPGSVSAMAILHQLPLRESSSCRDCHGRCQSPTLVMNGLGPVDDSDK
jgi:hypothetical protein